MANKLVICPTCGATIPKNVKRCPFCGTKQKSNKAWLIVIGVVVVAIIAIAGANGTTSTEKKTSPTDSKGNIVAEEKTTSTEVETTLSETDFKKMCESVKYKDVARNPDSYKGKNLKFRGKVIQVQESNYSDAVYRINVTKGKYDLWEDTVYVTYDLSDNEPRILEDDIVTFYGVCQGTESYTSVLGSKVTLPSLKAIYVEIEE